MQVSSNKETIYPIGVIWNMGNKFAREIMLNIAIRPLFYIPVDYDDDNKNNFDMSKDLFCLEYSAYIKFDPFYFGFQGSTDGRYYIAMKAVF